MKQNKKNRWPLSPLQKNYTLKTKQPFQKHWKKLWSALFSTEIDSQTVVVNLKSNKKEKPIRKKWNESFFSFFQNWPLGIQLTTMPLPPPCPAHCSALNITPMIPPKTYTPLGLLSSSKKIVYPSCKMTNFSKKLENISMMRTIYWKWAFCCGWTTIRCK